MLVGRCQDLNSQPALRTWVMVEKNNIESRYGLDQTCRQTKFHASRLLLAFIDMEECAI